MASFNSGTEGQRKFATIIRAQVLKRYPWGLNEPAADSVAFRLETIKSPLFFIKYKEALEAGEVMAALTRYDEENYQRRVKFALQRDK